MAERGVVYRSASMTIRDVRCDVHHEQLGPEECSDTHQIVLVRSGVFTKSAAGERIVADPNHVLFFTRCAPYRIAHPVLGGDVCTAVSMRTSDLLDIVASYAPRDGEREDAPFAFAWAPCGSRAFRLHHALLANLRRGRVTALAVEDLVFDLVDDLVGHAYAFFGARSDRESADTRERHRALVEAAKLSIEQRIDAPPTLGEIARALGCSPFHLSRVFHRETGAPLRRYLHRARLRTAAERLAQGEKNLTNLALSLGYADHSHFTNAFRREVGVSPSRFRRRSRKNVQA
jgi:AraC family transcriptional regulator